MPTVATQYMQVPCLLSIMIDFQPLFKTDPAAHTLSGDPSETAENLLLIVQG